MRGLVRADGAAMSSTHAPGVTATATDGATDDAVEAADGDRVEFDGPRATTPTGSADSGIGADDRPWARRFAVHCALVLLVLVGLVVVVDRGASVITDEGAV